MKHDAAVWRLASDSLEAGIPVTLLYVVDSQGSSPGRAGFAMTITATMTAGSIGGGAMEHRHIGLARQMLADGGPAYLQRQVHDPAAADDRSGMICSGEQTIWVSPLNLSDKRAIMAILESAAQRSGGCLRVDATGLSFDPAVHPGIRHQFVPGPDWSYLEDFGATDKLHLIGGGHCALALSRLCADLDFEITIYDDRPGLPTFDAITGAHRKVLVADYSEVASLIASGSNQFVCIMTFGYKTDDIALRALLDKDFRYIGLLGSRAKIDRMFAAYAAEGLEPDRLRRIQAPMGLPIHSQTPAEIAVSIAAQLIRVRNDPTFSRSAATGNLESADSTGYTQNQQGLKK